MKVPVKKNSQSGFTLIELMIVVSIVGILVSVGAPNYQKAVIRAREASLKRTLFTFRDVIDQYYSDHGKYPDSLEDLTRERYIRKVPVDPFTKSQHTWITVMPDDSEEGSVFDIHSGSDRVSLKGVPYNEW